MENKISLEEPGGGYSHDDKPPSKYSFISQLWDSLGRNRNIILYLRGPWPGLTCSTDINTNRTAQFLRSGKHSSA
jgi:hypothetical protein